MQKWKRSKDRWYLLERLKQARKEAGLTQMQVGKLMGTTHSNIGKVESGELRIDVLQLREFAKIYRKRLDWFLPK